MNKALKISVALVLVLQLLLPSFLLSYNKLLIDNTMKYGTEYTFLLKYIYSQRDFYDDEKYMISYEIYSGNLLLYLNDEISVDSYTDGFARVSERDPDDKSDNWFSYKSYCRNNYVSSDSFSSEDALRDVYLKLNQLDYGEKNILEDNIYLTAKVYKGMFIPTAIYLDGEKFITFSLST